MDCKQLHCWTARFIQQVREVKGSLQTTPQYLQHNSTQGWQGLDSFHLMWIFIAWSGEQSACGDFAWGWKGQKHTSRHCSVYWLSECDMSPNSAYWTHLLSPPHIQTRFHSLKCTGKPTPQKSSNTQCTPTHTWADYQNGNVLLRLNLIPFQLCTLWMADCCKIRWRSPQWCWTACHSSEYHVSLSEQTLAWLWCPDHCPADQNSTLLVSTATLAEQLMLVVRTWWALDSCSRGNRLLLLPHLWFWAALAIIARSWKWLYLQIQPGKADGSHCIANSIHPNGSQVHLCSLSHPCC